MSEARPLDKLDKLSIASAEGKDEDAIVAIDRACFCQVTINVPAELERPWSRVWVARDEAGAPRAFMLVWVVADELHILSLATEPQFRRRGIARKLLSHALEYAKSRKVRLLLLEVRRSNASALSLYRTFGFSAVGVRPRYYADNFEDAIEMVLELDPPTGKIIPGSDEVRL